MLFRSEELKNASPVFEQDVYQAISLERCIQARNIPGGPAPEAVREAIKKSRELLQQMSNNS